MSYVVLYCWCHIDSASVLLYFTFLSHLFPLPCGAGSTVELVVQFPARGSTQVSLYLFLVCCGYDTSYIVSVHIKCRTSIYTLSLCCGHSLRVWLAKQETLLLPGTWSHLWFTRVREFPPWCSIVGAAVTVHQVFCI